jgi:hypothetical protein
VLPDRIDPTPDPTAGVARTNRKHPPLPALRVVQSSHQLRA